MSSLQGQRESARVPFYTRYPFRQVRAAYPTAIIRLYCLIRAHILRQRLLAEVGQYVPHQGRVVEFGCGFGLFSLCFAMTRPTVALHACDLSESRIKTAKGVAAKLGVSNCSFAYQDALDFIDTLPAFHCAYMFDLLHHMPPKAVPVFLGKVWEKLEPGGTLLVKDVDNKPFLKMSFTYILDVLMTRGERPDYWASEDLACLLADLGGEVRVHALEDYLPFPHRLFVIAKPL